MSKPVQLSLAVIRQLIVVIRRWLGIFLLMQAGISVQTVYAEDIEIVTELFYPFQVLDDKQQLTGYSVDVVKALVKEAGDGSDPDISILPWSVAYDRALNHANTLIFSMSRTTVREAHFKWLAPVANEKTYLWALASSEIAKSDSLSDFTTYRIAVIKDAVTHQYLAHNGFDNLYLMTGMNANASEAHRIRMLLAGRADIVIAPKPTIISSLSSLNQPSDLLNAVHRATDLDNDLYIAFNIDTEPFILHKYQAAMQQLQERGELRALKQKWQVE